MKQRKAMYAGSFDPLTNGHLWVIERAITLFDELTIAIGVNPDKKYFLTTEQREKHITEAVKTLDTSSCKVDVQIIKNKYLAGYAKEVGASCLIRGIRSESDFNYEYAMAQVNRKIEPSVDSIYMMPPPTLAQVSSSLVKSMIGPEGWQDLVKNYVPETVYQDLVNK